jgi:hypothetical protein
MNKLILVSPGRLYAGFALAVSVMLSGCASAPVGANIVPTVNVSTHHAATVAVSASTMLGKAAPDGKNEAGKLIEDAITSAITQSKVFSQVVQRGDAQYTLTTLLISNDLPVFAATMTSKCEMGWTLTKADGSSVWKQIILSQGVTAGSEAFVGAERARMATERAIRDNISQALTAISGLNL